EARLRTWFEVFGPALALRCRTVGREDGVEEEWSAKASSHNVQALRDLLTIAEKYSLEVSVTIEIEKQPLEDVLLSILKDGNVSKHDEQFALKFFFFGERFGEILHGSQPQFFERTFLEATGKTSHNRILVVLLADLPGLLQGDYLAILGKDHLN